MTQIRSMTQPVPRRPGELGVHSLDHFTLQVPDVAAAEKFYGQFGLDMKEEGGNLSVYTRGHPHRWGTIGEGARKKLNYVSFGAFEDDMPRFRERLEKMRIDRLDPPKGFESNGLWFRDPDGTLIEIRVAEKSSPDEKTRFDMVGGEPGRPNAPARSKAPRVHPRRLAHILLFTHDIPKTLAFYRDVLGMRLSDRSGDLIAFMHGIHGSDHHMMAFAKSDAPGHHHFSWDVGSVQDVEVAGIAALVVGQHQDPAVVLGGIHPTACPEEAMAHADAVVVAVARARLTLKSARASRSSARAASARSRSCPASRPTTIPTTSAGSSAIEVLISIPRGPNCRLTRHEIRELNAPTQVTCWPSLQRSWSVWHSCTGRPAPFPGRVRKSVLRGFAIKLC